MRTRGFTLIEMIVVLAIGLAMVILVVPIFQVTTKTVQNVEEKLAVYEAARNILDTLEQEVRQAMINERGEHFSIKHMPYKDTDAFTPDQSGSASTMDTIQYSQSRREACSLQLLRAEPGNNQWSASPTDRTTMIDGALAHPLDYNTQFLYQPEVHEAWIESIRSTLIYPLPQNDSGQNVVEGVAALTRQQLLSDVSQVEVSLYFQARDNEPNITSFLSWYNEWYGTPPSAPAALNLPPGGRLAPGSELQTELKYKDWIDDYTRKHLGGMNVIDFNVSYWNDVDGKFYDVGDKTVIYFAPPPKAIRLTITVCDFAKRKRVTLSRIVQVPCGMGDGNVNRTLSPDTAYLAPYPYNRAKDLTTLEPALILPPPAP